MAIAKVRLSWTSFDCRFSAHGHSHSYILRLILFTLGMSPDRQLLFYDCRSSFRVLCSMQFSSLCYLPLYGDVTSRLSTACMRPPRAMICSRGSFIDFFILTYYRGAYPLEYQIHCIRIPLSPNSSDLVKRSLEFFVLFFLFLLTTLVLAFVLLFVPPG